MKDISKEEERRVVKALERAVKYANAGLTPNAALTRVAREEKFAPQMIQRAVEAFNISKTRFHFKKTSGAERAESFPIADTAEILAAIFPAEPETEAKAAAQRLHVDYLGRGAPGDFMKVARAVPLPAAKPVESYPTDPEVPVRRALGEREKLGALLGRVKEAYRIVFRKMQEQVDKAAGYWRRPGAVEPFDLVEKRAVARYGDTGARLMALIHKAGNLDDRRLQVKRAGTPPETQMVFDGSREPYDAVGGAVFLAGQLVRLAKEAALIEDAYHEHAFRNLDFLPPGPVLDALDHFLPDEEEEKEARDMPSFLKQKRPEKVKEIYRALKREHPGMPAEVKSRISARQGKPGRQPVGPPYEAPLHHVRRKGRYVKKESAALEECLA